MDDLGDEPPQTAFQRPAAPFNEPRNRIIVLCLQAEQIGHHDEYRGGEKRELRPGLKQFGRLPDKHGNKRRCQGRHPVGSPPHCRSEAG